MLDDFLGYLFSNIDGVLCANSLWEILAFFSWYMNGKILAVHDVESCIPPSIFCPFLDMWKSLYYPCCCTSHDKPGDCGINGKSKCYCPRCCFDCMYKIWPAYLKVSAGEGKIDCQTCQLKSKFYTPCKHFRGHCSP